MNKYLEIREELMQVTSFANGVYTMYCITYPIERFSMYTIFRYGQYLGTKTLYKSDHFRTIRIALDHTSHIQYINKDRIT